MKKLLILLAFVPVLSFAQVDVWKPGYVWDSAANTGVDVWYGPGNKVTTNGAFARGANVLSNAGGLGIAESGSVLLRDGRSVTLTATRLATAGGLAAAAARLASGPYGILAVLALPAVYDWITAEGGNKIRVNPTRTGVEMSHLACVSPCGYTSNFNGRTSPASGSAQASQQWIVTDFNATHTPNDFHLVSSSETSGYMESVSKSYINYTFLTSKNGADSKVWDPSTMDDISPYMTPRLPAQSYPKQIIDAGGDIDVSPLSVTGPSPALPQLPPAVKETIYGKPADVTGPSVVTPGNPFGLPANTPTVTNVTTSSGSLSPTSSTVTGSPSSPFPDHGPVSTPKTTTTTSNYNPTTNETTSHDVTTQDSAKQTTTSTNITNITNTTNTSTVTNNTTNVTNITNTSTNTPLAPPKTDQVTNKPLEDKQSQCEKSPDTIGCAKFGDAPASDKLNKKTTDVVVTPVTFLSASSCPSPLAFSVIGHQYGVSYEPLCDRLAVLKYLFLAMAGFVAAWVVASLFKV